MNLSLSKRFHLYIVGIVSIGILTLLLHDYASNVKLLRDIGIAEADRLAKTLFSQLHTSMRLGGGREENRAVVERFSAMDGVREVRIVHGVSLDRQYGMEEGEMPLDAHDRAALAGEEAMVVTSYGGVRHARAVTPVVLKGECLRCHIGKAGDVAGAISVTVSLEKAQAIIAWHARKFMIWGVGIVALTSAAIVLTVRRRLIAPIAALKRGADTFASGDLAHRMELATGDEFEEVGSAFDSMARSLSDALSRLRESKEKYSVILNMAADAIVLKDAGTCLFMDANPAALNLTGYARGEFLSLRPEDVFPSEKLGEYRGAFGRWLHDGRGYMHDAIVLKKDGFTVPVEIAASVVEIDGVKCVQEIWRDLTERKGFGETLKRYVEDLEGMVRERTDKLNRSLAELEGAYAKLKGSEERHIQSAKLVSLGEMGAGIAHELNSPLAGILSITEVVAKRLPPEDPNRKLLEKVRDAAVRSKYIIRDMLLYARPGKGGREPIFLNETIRATLCLFISEIKHTSVEIVEEFDRELPRILGNQGQLMEVFHNIIKNACDAMGAEGRLLISTRLSSEEGYAVAEIRDTGPGIPPGLENKIFDPFFTTKEKGGGLNIGLGLSIALGIVKGHSGRIEAFNSAGGGAVFRVTLPLAGEMDGNTAL